MPVARLTKTFVEALQPQQADVLFWDATLKGFGLKLTPTGRRVYLLQYRPRFSPTARRFTIGAHGSPWTTERARIEAVDLLARIRLGEDPALTIREERERERAAAAAAKAELERIENEAFERVLAEFIQKHASTTRTGWETERILRKDALTAWGRRPISTITRRDIIELIDVASARAPGAGRLLLAHLRKLFNWCLERDYLATSPCLGVKGPRAPDARDRWLSDYEVGLFWRACERLGGTFEPVFKVLLLTAQRRGEVVGMTWEEVDLRRAEWTIPARRAKNGRAHLVDLSPSVVSILEAQKGRSGLVFPRANGTALQPLDPARRQLREIMCDLHRANSAREGAPENELAAWRTHDLRRTAATHMLELGAHPHVVEAILNHVSGVRGGLVAVYQHFDHRPERKAALMTWAAKVRALSNSKTLEETVA